MKIKLYIYVEKTDENCNTMTNNRTPSVAYMESNGWACVKMSDCFDLEQYVKKNNIQIHVCLILCDPHWIFTHNNLDYLYKSTFYKLIFEGDLHKIKERNNIKSDEIHKKYISMTNLYVLANYWYCYSKFYPDVSQKSILPYPHAIHNDYHIAFNNSPKNNILLSGSCTGSYPARRKVKNMAQSNQRIHILTHKDKIYQKKYIEYMNQYLCCFTCCSNEYTPYLIGKFFEIPASGSLLLAYDKYIIEQLKNLGFIEGENYISCELWNIEAKIDFILNPRNRKEIDRIRKNGYELVWKKHTLNNRMKDIEKFILKTCFN